MNHREQVQNKSRELGHCMCSKLFTCPCNYFNDLDICKCAMEGQGVDMKKWIKYNTKADYE